MHRQYLVLELAAFEKHAAAIDGRNALIGKPGRVYAKLAAVGLHPAFVEVKDHGKLAAVVAAKLVAVPLVAGAGFIKRVVKFVVADAGVAAFVEVVYEVVHAVEEGELEGIGMAAVEPVDAVAAEGRACRS